MSRGGSRVGAGRKPLLNEWTRLAIGAKAHNFLNERAVQEAHERLANKALLKKAADARARVEEKYNWPERRAKVIAKRRQQLAARGWTDDDLDELAKNTIVSPPPGMKEDMQAAVQKVFGKRSRYYSEPLRRPYRARGKQFEKNALETVADDYQVSLRMVTSCLEEYRTLLKRLVREGVVRPEAL